MTLDFKIDDQKLQKAFDGIKVGKMRTVYRKATRKGLTEVRKQAVANFKKIFKGSQRWRAIWVRNYAKKSVIGAYISLHKTNPKYYDGKPLLLRWMNVGTIDRKTSKGYNRGAMPDTDFFTNAVNAKMNQAEAVAVKEAREGLIKEARKQGFDV